jgi:hypothetical protein
MGAAGFPPAVPPQPAHWLETILWTVFRRTSGTRIWSFQGFEFSAPVSVSVSVSISIFVLLSAASNNRMEL